MTIRKLSSSTTEYWFDKTFWEGWKNISGCILQSQLSVLKKQYSELKFKKSFDKFSLTLTDLTVRLKLKKRTLKGAFVWDIPE